MKDKKFYAVKEIICTFEPNICELEENTQECPHKYFCDETARRLSKCKIIKK